MKRITLLTIVSMAVLATSCGQVVSSKDLSSDAANATEKQSTSRNRAEKPQYTGIVKKVDDIAQQITVRIDNLSNNSNGSGVIIAQEGNTYYVLTAKHVLCTSESPVECKSNGENQIVTPDGKTYAIDPETVKIPAEWLDLAVVTFKSKESYQVATLGNYQLKKQWIFTSGFPYPKDGSEPQRILTGGTVFKKEVADFATKESYSLLDGQGLVYTNISYRGMSGGAVLDSLGQVVGINTASEENVEMTEEGKFVFLNLGYSLGIPIRDFIGLVYPVTIESELLNLNEYIVAKLDNKDIQNIRQQLLVTKKMLKDTSYTEWINYGNKLWRYGENVEAIDAFNKAILLRDEPHEAYYSIGLAYIKKGEYKLAINVFKKATKLQKNEASYWRQLGYSYKLSENYTEALLAYKEALKYNQQNIAPHIEIGNLLKNSGKLLEAIDSYSTALDIKPHPRAYYNRSVTYSYLKEYDKALADFHKLNIINPIYIYEDYNALYSNIETQYSELNNPRFSTRNVSYFRQLIEVLYNADMHNISGFKLIYSLKQCKNLIDLDRTFEANSEYTEYLNSKCNKIQSKALEHFNKAIQINPQHAEAYKNRRDLYNQLQRHEEAQSEFQKLQKITLNYISILKYQGLILYEGHVISSSMEGSMGYWKRALQLAPETEETILALSVAMYQQGEIDKAVEMATKVLSPNQQWSDLDFLREQNWGEKLIADTQKLFNDERIKPLIE